ncbi:WD repeat-containing protein 47 [Tyrophagus putrescentiae]|nr:WD repeat-containing protein 47 [Tyrophagus putrescentiae]
MTTTTATTTATFSKVSVREEDAIRLILEFLSRRELCISQLSLERESGIYNCNVGDDLIFLRQLILDGQWEDALQFVTPLESLEHFASRQFHFLIYKHKYVELLCIRAEASCAPTSATTSSSLASVEVAVQDIIDCLNQLEVYAPSREDYHRLSSLLTIPSLSDDEELRNWNPNSWRLQCFHDVMPLVERFMTQQPTTASDTASNSSSTNKSGNNNNNNCIARNDRLMNLIFKGLMYEVCLETVAAKMVAADGGSNQCTTTTTSHRSRLPAALLAAYQADRSVRKNIGGGEGANRANEPPPMINLAIEKHDKPLLVASWSEMILAAPIKPNVFPHTQVPFTRIKAADLMSKSLSASLMKSASTRDMMAMSNEENEEEGEDKENTTNNSLQLELTTAIANCDSVMSTSVDRLFRSADAFTSSKGLQLTSKEAAAIGGTCSDRMPTITELATPTTPSTEAAAEFAPEYTSPTDHRRRTDDGDVDEMNESYLDIWMRSQHRRLKKNKLNRTLSNRLNSSGAHRRPPSLAGASTATSTTAAASVKRTAASTFSSGGGGGLPSSARKHSSTASWSSSAGKSSSITQQQQQQHQPMMPSASGPASSTSSFSGSSAASTGRVAADQQQQQQQLGHMPHNSSRFVATPANNTATNSTARPLTSTPLKWLPAGGAQTANSIRSELFDDRSVLRNSPITTEERNYGGGGSGYRHSTVAASNDGGNYYGYNSSSSSNSNKPILLGVGQPLQFNQCSSMCFFLS